MSSGRIELQLLGNGTIQTALGDRRKFRTVIFPTGPRGRDGAVSGSIAWTNVTGKPSTFPPSSHTHTPGEVGADPAGSAAAAQGAAEATAANALAAHVSATDPHTGYQSKTEKGVANGYTPLGPNGLVPSAYLPPSSGSVMTPRCNVSATSGSTTTSIPFDNTIPQITEGAEIISLANVEPSSSSSKILVQFSCFFVATTNNAMSFALFDGSANAVAATVTTIATTLVTISFVINSWSGPKTLSIRAGTPAGTLYWLRTASEDKFGSARQAVITAVEIPAS